MNKELRTVKIADLIPYANNPRNNDGSVEAVKASIEECGYISPIIVNEENVILAGHTRLKALRESGAETCEVICVSGMDETSERKYRILDNKTSERAEWDFEALRKEAEGLDFSFDFGIDDILSKGEQLKETAKKTAAGEKAKKTAKLCTCPRCGKQWEE